MKDDFLPEFQTFLRTQMLVPQKNVGFYACSRKCRAWIDSRL